MELKKYTPSGKFVEFDSSTINKIRSNKIKQTKKKIEPYKVKGDFNFNLDWKLKKDLDILLDDLEQNDDALIIIVAPEGAGKTVMETQIGFYCSLKTKQSWGVNNIHFDGQEYMDYSLKSPSKIVNALDESRRALNKMRGMSKGNVEFMNFVSECRSQNQIHIIVLPAFTDLEQYVAIHRVKMLIQIVKTRDPITKRLIRGNFKIIDTKNKGNLKDAWKNGYKEFPNNMVIHKGKFEGILCLNEKQYDKKKEEAKKERYMSEEDKNKNVQSEDPIKSLALEHYKTGKSKTDIAKSLNKHRNTINNWCKEFDTNMNNE